MTHFILTAVVDLTVQSPTTMNFSFFIKSVAILIMNRIAVALRSWGAAPVLLPASFAIYGYRICVEKKALVEYSGRSSGRV